MKQLQDNKGFTVIELLAVLATLASLGLTVAVIVAVVHFVGKFW